MRDASYHIGLWAQGVMSAQYAPIGPKFDPFVMGARNIRPLWRNYTHDTQRGSRVARVSGCPGGHPPMAAWLPGRAFSPGLPQAMSDYCWAVVVAGRIARFAATMARRDEQLI